MTKAGELYALAERCEVAAGPDRKLDAAIVVALDLRPDWCRDYGELYWIDEDWSDQPIIRANSTHGKRSLGHPPIGDYPRFTASLDAAMTLVPADSTWELTSEGAANILAPILDEPGWFTDEPVQAATPALSLCAAALKARAASADTHPKGGDAKQAPFMGSAVAESETPNLSHSEGE